MDISINSIQSLVYETAKTRVHERRYYETVNGSQTVRSEFYYFPLYNKRGEIQEHVEHGQQVDRRA